MKMTIEDDKMSAVGGIRKTELLAPSEAIEKIEAIANATGKPVNYILVRALETYLLNEGADVLSAIRGRDQIAAGEYEDMDDLIADVDKIVSGQAA